MERFLPRSATYASRCRLYRVEPWALLGQQATDDPYTLSDAFLDPAVMLRDPGAHLFACMPAGVVPHQDPNLLAQRTQLPRAPFKELGCDPAERAAINEPQPRLLKLWNEQPVAGDGFGVRIFFFDRVLHQAWGLLLTTPAVQRGQGQLAPPALVLETYHPTALASREVHQPVAPPFFLAY